MFRTKHVVPPTTKGVAVAIGLELGLGLGAALGLTVVRFACWSCLDLLNG